MIQHPLVPVCVVELMLATRSRKLRKKLRHTDDMKVVIILKLQTPTFTPKEARPQYKASNMLILQKASVFVFPFNLSGHKGTDMASAEDDDPLSSDSMGISWIPNARKG